MFEFLFLPLGLRNAAATFQRFMDNIFRDLTFVFVYLDDLLIFSRNEQQHYEHLKTVFRILEENHLRLAMEKC